MGRVLRAFLLLLALSLSLPLLAQNALVLIQHERAGPSLPTGDYIFGEWVRWPEDQPGRNNRILSLATGVDLQAEFSDTRFKTVEGDGKSAVNGEWLKARGFFEARAANLDGVTTAVVQKPRGGVSPSVLLLALDDPHGVVRPLPFASTLPSDGLVLYEAAGWDDAVAISRRVSGRTLMVEYPPDGTDRWSRYWLRGPWPRGVPVDASLAVPGLVQGRSVLRLLLHPERFEWGPSDAGRWGGANRWLEHGRDGGRILLSSWFGLAILVIAWGLAQVMNEDRGPFVSEMLLVAILSPAAIVLSGAAARFGGIEAWPLWTVLATVVLYGATTLAGLAARRWAPGAHPLWAASLVGLGTLVLFDPLWSDLSGRFGPLDIDVPSEAVGSLVGYLTGAMVFAPGRWFGRALGLAMVVWGITGHAWWVGDHSALLVLPAMGLAASEGLFRPALLLVLALLPTELLRLARVGAAWSPDDLLLSAADRDATNFWHSARFLVSYQWVGCLVFAAGLGLVGNRFLAYRLRKLWRLDPRLRALPWAAAGTLALGVLEPLALPAAPVVALGALAAFAYDGLRANA